jgi:A/G-specific adenine glycosylase
VNRTQNQADLPTSLETNLQNHRAEFTRQLCAWFALAQRDLPWRHKANARDPYRVLVSEIMLQQTVVATVIPFYERFLKRFPTIEDLANASLEEVLPLWAGLGYYSRARNLHKLAQVVMQEQGGKFPNALEDVLKLPGVGRYTAGAVTSIAFDTPSPIVDANVARVFSRLFLLEGDLKSSANQQKLWYEATETVRIGKENNCAPSQLNPALMELGALICTPKNPKCPKCPVNDFCAARKANRQNELPHATPKAQQVFLRDACAFLHRDNQIFLRQRPHEAKIWWRGMWELPRVTAREEESVENALQRMLREELKIEAGIGGLLKTIAHGVTHHHITLDCFAIETEEAPQGGQWLSFAETEALAMPSAMRRLVQWLQKHPQGHEKPRQLSLL